MNKYIDDTYLIQDNSANTLLDTFLDESVIKRCDNDNDNDNDWGDIVDHTTSESSSVNSTLTLTIEPTNKVEYVVNSATSMTDFMSNISNSDSNAINEHGEYNLHDKNTYKILEHVDIEEVKLLDIKPLSDLILLEKASMIVKNLKFQFNKRCNEEQDKFMTWIATSLIWLNNVMNELAKRNKQSMICSDISIDKSIDKQINKQTKKFIMRTSYKFCEFGHNCKFNYNLKEKCYAQHYVFNYVSQDISSVIDFIITDYDTITLRPIDDNNELIEIKTSINTITYVINHMYDELLQLKNINPIFYENYEKRVYNFHIVHEKKRPNRIINTQNIRYN